MMSSLRPLPSPHDLRCAYPLHSSAHTHVERSRDQVRSALYGENFLVIVGPCSLDDEEAALQYATRLAALQKELPSQWVILMRAFFEKPRSLDGWKGFLHAETSEEHAIRLEQTRALLTALLAQGIALGAELLQPSVLPYIEDCLSWGAIGARTCSSQIHRELASSAPFPVGIKNDLHGSIQPALDSIWSARSPQSTYQIGPDGRLCAMISRGNPDGHLIFRGGWKGPNISLEHLEEARIGLQQRQIRTKFLIDCAHGNSFKTARGQLEVLKTLPVGHAQLGGIMLESYLEEGNQSLHRTEIRRGISVTDPCLGWDQTVEALYSLSEAWSAGSIQVNHS